MENDIEQPLLQDHNLEGNTVNTCNTSDEYNQDQSRTFWQHVSFNWIAPLLRLGFTLPQLHQHHLPPLPPQAASDVCGDALWQAWEREIDAENRSGMSPSLLRALFHTFGWPFLALGGLKFINDALNFAGPVLLNGLLQYLDSNSTQNRGSGTAGAATTAGFFSLLPPPLLRTTSNSTDAVLDPTSTIFGAGCAALLALTFFLKAFLNAQFSYRQGVISAQVRAALTSLCFRQSLVLSQSQVSTVGTGRIQTLMSVDADKVLGLFIGFHELWSLPFQICIALYLLYLQVHFAFLAGLLLVLLIIPLNKALANGIQRASVTMMAAKDQRIAIISELLKGIRVIKASGWEAAFTNRVNVARKKELHSLAIRKYLDAVCVYLWAATSLLFSLGTFGLFVVLGQQLTAQMVFTSLALFSVLLGPINSFPWVINGIVEAVVSLKRLSSFLNLRSPTKNNTLLLPPAISTTTNTTNDTLAIEIINGNFQWSPSSSTSSPSSPSLQNITLSIPKGSFVVVTGHVGSGKSSLFHAILGEMYTSSPSGAIAQHVVRVVGKTAYAAQDAWLMPGSIKDNITLTNSNTTTSSSNLQKDGSTYDEIQTDERYTQILQACAFSSDELSSLSRGDHTHVGDSGSTVSGGQRARIALARALYSNADLYLLDDVLASVDATVASWLIDHVLLDGPFLDNKTVLIATHSPVLIDAADMVVTMKEGKIESILDRKKSGSGSGRGGSSTYFGRRRGRKRGSGGGLVGSGSSSNKVEEKKKRVEGDNLTPESESDGHEMRAVGHVRWSMYRFYVAMQGIWAPLTLVSLALMQATRNGSDLWLSYWVTHNKLNNGTASTGTSTSFLPGALPDAHFYATIDNDNQFLLFENHSKIDTLDPEVKFYLGVLLYIAAANSIFTLIRAFSFAQGGLVAARRLHQKLVTSILSLPTTFFDVNPSGRILNRFSSDTAIADDSLPFISNIFLAQLFGLAGVALVLCFTQPYMLLTLLPIAFAYRILQKYYRASSRELRRLESIAKSPVYSTFSAALSGGTTIRAFAVSKKFLSSAHQAIDAQQRASLTALAASTWLGLRLQIVAGVIAAVVGGLAVVQKIGILPGAVQGTSAGFVGLSLAYALPITGLLNGLLTCGAETEQEMVSVERISEYINETPQADVIYSSSTNGTANNSTANSSTSINNSVDNNRLLPPNVSGASILFENLWMQYTASSAPVLANFNLSIPAGIHAGICGRTGAGKSSLVSCLLRLVEINSGKICIDGVDIRTIPLRTLRSMIGFVPQSPFLFSGTVAENVDPMGKYSSEAIVDALHRVGLWPALHAMLANRDGSGSGFSVENEQQQEENVVLLAQEDPANYNQVLNLKLGNEGGIGLSQGQQQMLCLARVVLESKKLKILCLDEASASVDPGTAESMQKVIKSCFQGCTIIEVAHRLRNIAECDVIYVIDQGQVVEVGAPKTLAEDSRSVFAGMLREQADKGGCSLM